jgi:pilus assembly protein CpaB
LLLLALALACGGLAAYATMQYLRENTMVPTLNSAPTPSSQVVVAARNLEPGIPLGPEDVKVIEWPGGNIPVGYGRTVEDVIGRSLIAQALMNEPVMDAKLADRGARGLQVEIPENMRAVTVRVDDASGVSGFILPKHRIDLMLTVGGGAPDAVTKLIMQNLTVIASGTVREKDEKGEVIPVPTLTVLVSPEDAEKLKHAETQGRMTFALRNAADLKEIRTPGIRLAGVMSGTSTGTAGTTVRRSAPPTVAPAAPLEKTVVEIIKSGVRQQICFGPGCGSGGN